MKFGRPRIPHSEHSVRELPVRELNGDIDNVCIGTAQGREQKVQDFLDSYEPDSDQEDVIHESVFVDPPLDVHDICKRSTFDVWNKYSLPQAKSMPAKLVNNRVQRFLLMFDFPKIC